MKAKSNGLFLGFAALAFMTLSLFHAPFETFGLDSWAIGWLLSRLVQTLLIAGGLTLVMRISSASLAAGNECMRISNSLMSLSLVR